MRLKVNRQLSVGFISLGCPKNLVDSEIIATSLLRAGLKLARTPEQSDVLIINTCAFIHDAQKEAVGVILNACEIKKKGRPQFIIVAGCLPQRYRGDLKELLPEVDAFIGLDQLKLAPEIIKRLAQGARNIMEISPSARARINPPAGRIIFTSAPYAYLKIAEGCNHNCAFCAIPQIRGRFRSRSVASIVREADDLLSRGVRELNLIAQDVTAYGCDRGGKADLAFLLKQLGRLGGRFWIRFLYGHPQHINDKLLAAMSETAQVCHYIDMPIQHCDTDILRRMGRGGDAAGLRALIHRIRKNLPDVSLRTTCLVGFPGETEACFERLLGFVREIEFDHLGVFVYSAEEGTRAAELPDQVSRTLARTRKDVLMGWQQKIVAQKTAAAIGKAEEILVEKKKENAKYIWLARSRRQAPEVDSRVYLRDYAQTAGPGTFVNARYVKAKGYDLIAKVEDN